MEKSLTMHHQYIATEIESLTGKNARSRAEELYYYHVDRVHDFQHERQIHLQVTFFFSALLLLSIVGLLWVAGLNLAGMLPLTILFLAMGVILFVTVLFYVRHYYQLENGVQGLYALTKQLRDIIAS